MSEEILFIGHRIPFPPNRGDKIRSHHILKRLARLAPVHVACFADDDADMGEEVELAAMAHSYRLVRRAVPLAVAGVRALAARKPVSLTAFYDAQLAAYIDAMLASGRIGTIYVFSGQMGQYVPADFRGQVVMDFVDVDSAKFEAYAQGARGPMRWLFQREERLMRAEEERLALRADVSLLVSHRETQLFIERLSPAAQRLAHVSVIGNGIDSDYFDPAQVSPDPLMAQADGPRLIFTGQMDYPPNIMAVQRMVHKVMPILRQSLPEASFHIIGRNPAAEVRVLDGLSGTQVWGAVPDIRPYLKAADMALVPLEIARGIQNKVLEAMAMQLPVVVSGAAATGINGVSGLHYMVADSDADLAAAIIHMAADTRFATAMGHEARRFVVERQGWQSALAPLADIIHPVACAA